MVHSEANYLTIGLSLFVIPMHILKDGSASLSFQCIF